MTHKASELKYKLTCFLISRVASRGLLDVQDSVSWAATLEGEKLLPSCGRVGIRSERRASSVVRSTVLGGPCAASAGAHFVGRELQVGSRSRGDETVARSLSGR